jgi:hypothetical protein
MYLPVERKAGQSLRRSAMNLAHETQGLAVGTYQDVKTVVERDPVDEDASRPASELTRRFVYGHRDTRIGERYRRGEARVAAADDGDVHRRWSVGA